MYAKSLYTQHTYPNFRSVLDFYHQWSSLVELVQGELGTCIVHRGWCGHYRWDRTGTRSTIGLNINDCKPVTSTRTGYAVTILVPVVAQCLRQKRFQYIWSRCCEGSYFECLPSQYCLKDIEQQTPPDRSQGWCLVEGKQRSQWQV